MESNIILASASPRRKLLIEQAGLHVEIRPVNIAEAFSDLPPLEDAIKIAGEKLDSALAIHKAEAAKDAQRSQPAVWILAADTIVSVEGHKLGKPVSRENARDILQLLQGQTHQVITGLAMYSSKTGTTTESAVTEVSFSPMTETEIEGYLDTGEWQGVAAGYRIQGAAAKFIPSIKGSYSNVMGLPIHTFYGMLIAHGYPIS